jgi:hypothetical protein
VAQSYANFGGGVLGSGTYDRSILITVTSGGFPGGLGGSEQALVSGSGSFNFNSGFTANTSHIDFHFLGKKRLVTAARVYASGAYGDWKVRGSQDGTTWTDIGSATLTGTSPQDISCSGNTTAYAYYSLMPTTSSSGTGFVMTRVDFEISGNDYEWGNRNTGSLVVATTNVSMSGGGTTAMFDGNLATNGTNSWWSGDAATGKYIQFDFAEPVELVNLYSYDSGGSNNATWSVEKWDGSSWVQVCAPKLWDLSSFAGKTFACTKTGLSTRYRMLGISGTMNSGPFYEEFGFDLNVATDALSFTGATAYDWAGAGRRDWLIETSTTCNITNGPISNLVNGLTTTGNDAGVFCNASESGREFKFKWPWPVRIDEFKWIQDSTGSQGTWKIAGSNNDIVYTDLLTGINLGNAAATDTHAFTNPAGYKYYKLIQTSGSTTTSRWIEEVEFKVARADDYGAGTAIGATSYSNAYGSGNRHDLMLVLLNQAQACGSGGSGFNDGRMQGLVDGDTTTAGCTTSAAFSSSHLTGLELLFAFREALVIDEFKWIQALTVSHGTWKVQGSVDNVTFSDLGSTFTLGGVTTQTQSITNASAYNFYKLVQTAGSADNSTWIYEVQFKTAQVASGNYMAAFETKDTFAATGFPGVTGISGTLSATDVKDTFAATGDTTLSGVLAATDTKDTFAGTGVVPPVGSIAISEDKDVWSTSNGFELPGIEQTGIVGAPFNLTTNGPNRIVVIMVAQDGNNVMGTVSSITGAGLTWKQRQVGEVFLPNHSAWNGLSLEVWWAYAPTKIVNEGISVTFAGGTNTQILAYAVVKGMNGNYSDPWARVELPSGGGFAAPPANILNPQYSGVLPAGGGGGGGHGNGLPYNATPDSGTPQIPSISPYGTGPDARNSVPFTSIVWAFSMNDALDTDPVPTLIPPFTTIAASGFAGLKRGSINLAAQIEYTSRPWEASDSSLVPLEWGSLQSRYLVLADSMHPVLPPSRWLSQEAADTCHANGYVGSSAGPTGQLHATDTKDTFAAVGWQATSGVLNAFEKKDTFSAFIRVPIFGTFVTTEAKDRMTAAGIGWGEDGTFISTESVDIFAAAGYTPVSGTLNAIETADRARFLGAGVVSQRKRRIFYVT